MRSGSGALSTTGTNLDAKNDNLKLNTIASYAMKKFGIEYQGFLLRFCTHRNEFNCVFMFTKLRKYAIRSLIWSYDYFRPPGVNIFCQNQIAMNMFLF